jgi:O-antigen/teichoic acid export membrane protein
MFHPRRVAASGLAILRSPLMRRAIIFFTTQASSQILTLLTGLIVVRLLDYGDYAVYIYVGTLIGLAGIAGDLGTGRGMLVFCSKTTDKDERRRIFWEAERLRFLFLGFALAFVAVVFFVYEDMYTILPAWEVGVVFAILCANVALQNQSSLRRSYLAAEARLGAINRADPLAAALRLGIIGGVFAAAWPSDLLLPLIANLLAAFLVFVWLRRQQPRHDAHRDLAARRSLLRFIRPLIPLHLETAGRSLLPILGLSWFAQPQDIAELGALSRLGLAASLITPLISYIGQPFVARANAEQFLWRGLAVVGFVAGCGTVLVLSGLAVPHLWLLLVGGKYAHLEAYVWLALLLASLEVFNGTLYFMIQASGDTSYQPVVVFASLATQAALVVMSPITDLDSAYLFLIATAAINCLGHAGLFIRATGRMATTRR